LGLLLFVQGVSSLPDESRSKDGLHALQDDFGFGLDAPADIVIDGNLQSPEVLGAIDALIARFGESDLEINDTNDLGVLSVHLSGDLTNKATTDAVRELRDDFITDALRGFKPQCTSVARQRMTSTSTTSPRGTNPLCSPSCWDSTSSRC
jgi:hypothetical protein